MTAGAPAVRFTFDGRVIQARPGQSIAAALVGSGVLALRRSRRLGAPRGLYCGIGACFECLVDVDGVPALRACLEPVREGCVVRTSASRGGPGAR